MEASTKVKRRLRTAAVVRKHVLGPERIVSRLQASCKHPKEGRKAVQYSKHYNKTQGMVRQ